MSDVNWDVELKKIEREYSGLAPEPTAAQKQARLNAERRAREIRDSAQAGAGATVRLALVAAMFGALFIWPYQRDCGMGLFGYMAVQASIAVGALWVLTFTWQHRLARRHALAFAILIGALALLASEVLPRIGYDWVDRAGPKQLWCATR
jgi:hypothetical protein